MHIKPTCVFSSDLVLRHPSKRNAQNNRKGNDCQCNLRHLQHLYICVHVKNRKKNRCEMLKNCTWCDGLLILHSKSLLENIHLAPLLLVFSVFTSFINYILHHHKFKAELHSWPRVYGSGKQASSPRSGQHCICRHSNLIHHLQGDQLIHYWVRRSPLLCFQFTSTYSAFKHPLLTSKPAHSLGWRIESCQASFVEI